jgi:hypothetical protein
VLATVLLDSLEDGRVLRTFDPDAADARLLWTTLCVVSAATVVFEELTVCARTIPHDVCVYHCTLTTTGLFLPTVTAVVTMVTVFTAVVVVSHGQNRSDSNNSNLIKNKIHHKNS